MKFKILLILAVFTTALHLPSFFYSHREGDELVYMGLARSMSWLGENYSTADIPIVNEFPARLYRAEYFIHPPLYPYLLKIFAACGNMETLGLVFNLVLHVGTAYLVLITLTSLGVSLATACLMSIVTVLCPILTATTIKLHIDALSGVLMLLSFYLTTWANGSGRNSHKKWPWLIAGLSWGLALNTKLTAFAAIPALILNLIMVGSKGRWLTLAVAMTFVSPHVYSLLSHYHTLYPADLLTRDRPIGNYLMRIISRTRANSLLNLIALVPLMSIMLSSWFWRRLYQLSKQDRVCLALISLFLSLFLSVFLLHHATEGYYAIALPCFYVLTGVLIDNRMRRSPSSVLLIFAIPVLLMGFSSFWKGVIQPQADLSVPSLILIVPPISRYYR